MGAVSLLLSLALFLAWFAGLGLAFRWLQAELGFGPRRGNWRAQQRFTGRKR